MKVKKLIELLQEEDPTGEAEACVGNCDILFVEAVPSYYDGRLQVLIRDESSKYYNVIGAEYRSSGTKVKIRTHSISDAIFENPDLPVDYSGCLSCADEYRASDDKTRAEARAMDRRLELQLFQRWAEEKAEVVSGNKDDLMDVVETFFDTFLSRSDLLPASLLVGYGSYVDKRKKQWDKEIGLTYIGGGWKLAFNKGFERQPKNPKPPEEEQK